MRMKKSIMIFLMLLLILPVTSLAADRPLPDEILNVFQTPEWEGYAIPTIPEDTYFGGLLASYYYDENNHAAAVAIMKKDDINVLCVLEKKNNAWVIVAQSSKAVLQGDEIPFVSSEIYGEFYLYYYHTDRQPVLGITIDRLDDSWYITELSHREDMTSLYVAISESDLSYNGNETNWEQVVVKGHIENSLEMFNLETFPLTIKAAQALFSEDTGE
jgi:hypothetical protein